MKKLFLFAVVALSMGLVACTGSNNTSTSTSASNNDAAQNAEEITDGNTFEGKNYSVTYPKDWKETFSSSNILNAKSADELMSLSMNFTETGPSVDQLEETGANMKIVNQSEYKEVGDPKIDGNVVVVRRVGKDGEVEFSYVKVLDGTSGVMGSVKAPGDKEADAEKIMQSILASVKMK